MRSGPDLEHNLDGAIGALAALHAVQLTHGAGLLFEGLEVDALDASIQGGADVAFRFGEGHGGDPPDLVCGQLGVVLRGAFGLGGVGGA